MKCAGVLKCILLMTIITMTVIIVLHVLALYAMSNGSKQWNKEPPILDTVLYGREKEQTELLEKILTKKHQVIEIIGFVGVGKTALVLNTTDMLVKKDNYCLIYIELPRNTTVDISSLIIHKLSQRDCMATNEGWTFTLSSAYYIIFKMFLNSHQQFQYWYDLLQPNTVLVFDNADQILEDIEIGIIEPLLDQKSKSIVVLLIAHESKRVYLKRPVIPLSGIPLRECKTWIVSKYQQVSSIEGEHLCQELGGVPSDVIDAVELVLNPLSSQSTYDVITGLKSPEYGGGFRYLESILGRHFKDTKGRNIAKYIRYNRLSFAHRECIWLLVEITENGEFTKEMAENHLEQNVDRCIDSLLNNRFLDMLQIMPHKKFRFPRNIIKFIQSIGQPIPDIEDVRGKVWAFYGNYVKYNARSLYSELQTTRNLQLAIEIGSDRELVNSLVPLLGEKFSLRPLFKMALEVIEEYYCTPKGMYNSSSSKSLLGFSYLTKAVHCPSIHPPSMLSSKVNFVPKPKLNMCLDKLNSCPALLSMDKNSYEVAEALGYHNSLLIYACNISNLPTVPWQYSLIDLSMIVTVANRECVKFCKRDKYCHCGKQSHMEYGLRQLLLRNYAMSTKYFQSTQYQQKANDLQCHTILKIIAIIGIDYASHNTETAIDVHSHHLMNIDFDNLDLSCFLGLFNDVIIPYLVHINHKKALFLKQKLEQIVSRVDKHCNTEAKTNEQ